MNEYDTLEVALRERHRLVEETLIHKLGQDRVKVIAPGVYHLLKLIPHEEAIAGYESLLKECKWLDLTFKEGQLPRKEAFQAVCVPRSVPQSDGSVATRMCRTWYPWDVGNIDIIPQDPTPTVMEAAKRVQGIHELKLEELHVVVNAYLQPSHHIGQHQDKMIGADRKQPCDIFTVTYAPEGSEWLFRIRDITRKLLPSSKSSVPIRRQHSTISDPGTFVLRPGDAVLMLFEANMIYFHEVAGPLSKEPKEFRPRISVTIRSMAAACDPTTSTWYAANSSHPMSRDETVAWLEKERSAHFKRERILRDCFLKRQGQEQQPPQPHKQLKISQNKLWKFGLFFLVVALLLRFVISF